MQWQTRRQNLRKQWLHFLRLANLISSKNKLINDWSFSNGYNVYSLLLLLRNFWHTGDKKVIAILLAWRQSSPPTNPKSSRETQLAQLKKRTGFRRICEQLDEWIILIFPHGTPLTCQVTSAIVLALSFGRSQGVFLRVVRFPPHKSRLLEQSSEKRLCRFKLRQEINNARM